MLFGYGFFAFVSRNSVWRIIKLDNLPGREKETERDIYNNIVSV